MTKTSEIFYVSDYPENVICPPDQVFIKNPDMEFLLTSGGHLVKDDKQYENTMILLRELGETEFNLRENVGATLTDRQTPFQTTFSTASDLEEFNRKTGEFDEFFSFGYFHWFIHGQRTNWGIYVAEYPTINIIGCTRDLSEHFRKVFKIEGNGYNQVKKLLNSELNLHSKPEDKISFFKNYKIKTSGNL